jgi:hypothetical protein
MPAAIEPTEKKVAFVHWAASASRTACVYHLLQPQEVVGLVVLEAKARPTRGIDLDGAGDAKLVGACPLREGRAARRRPPDQSARQCDPEAHRTLPLMFAEISSTAA